MNDYEKKIHKLSQELIPVFDELDTETKEIINEHAEQCSVCDNVLDKRETLDVEMGNVEDDGDVDTPIQPLRKLVHINRGIRTMLFLIRVLVLSVVALNTLRSHNFSEGLAIQTFQFGTLFFYLPTAIFLLFFTWIFLEKRWTVYSLMADIVILLAIWQLPLFY